MQNALLADILAQGQNLKNTIAHLFGPERENLAAAAKFLGSERPIIFLGMASAEFLCMPAAVFLGERGRLAGTMSASDALYSHLPSLRGAGLVINSRSGETAEVVKLARALRDYDIPFVALTNEPLSTLAGLAEQVIWTNTRKDDLVSINVVTGMMTAALALAAEIGGGLDALRPEFLRLPEAMQSVVTRAVDQAPAMRDLFRAVRPITLLYRGCSRGPAWCGRLVLEEVARTPGVPIEAAEFRQGPNEVVDELFGAVMFLPEGQQGLLNRALAGDILRSGGRVLLIGDPEQVRGMESDRAQAFAIPPVAACLRPVLEVVPLQALAFELAQAQGYPPGTVRYITKVILDEEGIPNEEV